MGCTVVGRHSRRKLPLGRVVLDLTRVMCELAVNTSIRPFRK